jgi:predicted RNA polymerase sigma factor
MLRAAYRWERVQTPQNPKFWLMVNEPDQVRIATLPDQHFHGRAR